MSSPVDGGNDEGGAPSGTAALASSSWRGRLIRASLGLGLTAACLAVLAAHLEPRVMMAMVAWVC
jgi:hypothetical protein